MNNRPLDVLIIGGGMITNDLLLPSVYHLQRLGVVGEITVCALGSAPLKALADNADLRAAFPGQTFTPMPPLATPADQAFPDLYKDALARLRPRQAVIVAVPDWFHYPIIMEALGRDQHVLSVKPLVLEYQQDLEIERLAREKGLFVGVEYHKRFDRRSLQAKRLYAEGKVGKFIMGEAKLYEPYYYRHSNFQNWFTCDKTDPFTYVGCHYVDLVYFITGLKPVAVSVDGVRGRFPNGKEAFLWSSGRVRFENGALLTVTDGLGYPDEAAGYNDQGLVMYCEGPDRTGMINHDDHERGVRYAFLEPLGGARYRYVSPDFYRLVPWEGAGARPIGYGYESVAASLQTMQRIEATCDGLAARQKVIREIDEAGIIATPANSSINELVIEAARRSILADGELVKIQYGAHPHVG